MNVLFIYPNAGSQLGFNYGLAHISAGLKQAGHRTRLLQLCEDLGPLPEQESFCAAVRQFNPDVIGFSVVTTQWPYAMQLARWARAASRAPLVCGGIHATVAAADILTSGTFDYVFVGECDTAFPEFVDRLARGEDVRTIRNLGYLDDGQPRLNPVRPFPDLASLPVKDYDLFDFQQLIDAKRGWVGLMASRGCPFSCTYCFNHHMVQHYRSDLHCSAHDLGYIRHFPVGQVIDEISYLLTHYRNITMFIFDDDLFTYDAGYVREFCRAYRRACQVPFVVNAHVGFFDDERAQALAAAGCRIVKFGLESGSERVRRQIMNRHMSNEQIKAALACVHRAGMHSSCFVMIGLPGETPADVTATVRLLAEAQPGRFRWTFFYPFPGTASYDLSVQGGYVRFDRMQSLANFTDASCLDFGEEQNLLLAKVGKVMPWFVNAAADFAAAPEYQRRVDEILALDGPAWAAGEPGLLAEDKRRSQDCSSRGQRHYAIKYNPFMGVISDYFRHES